MLLFGKVGSTVRDGVCAGFFAAFGAERILNARREKINLKQVLESLACDDVLIRQNESTLSRIKTLEEKARGNLFALTICSTIIFSGLALAANHDVIEVLRNARAHVVILAFLLLLALLPMAYFAAAGYAALRVLQVGSVYELSTEEEQSSPLSIRGRREWYMQLNQITGNIKANWTWVSFACLRNAVICLLLFVFVTISSLLFAIPRPRPSLEKVPNSPRLQRVNRG